jgi:REP element-mobilizing transposase RayT
LLARFAFRRQWDSELRNGFDFVRRAKGRSSRKIQNEFEHIRKRNWGQRFWLRGYFPTTSGNIIDGIIMWYLDRRTPKDDFSPPHNPTGVSQSVV